MVRSGNVVGNAINIKLVFKPDSESVNPGVIVPRIYLGRLATPGWSAWSTDFPNDSETVLVVIPSGIGEGNAICSFWQMVDFTPSKMTNVVNMADSVTYVFSVTDGSRNCSFRAITSSNETAERQQLTLVLTYNHYRIATTSLTLELQDLRPSLSGHQPRRANDSTTEVINDDNNIAGGSQNGGSSLVRSLVELGPRIVELTNNKPNEKFNDSEQAIRDRDAVIAQLESKLQVNQLESQLRATQLESRVAQFESQLRVAQLESQLQVAQLESQLRASQFENKLLVTKLVETERAREKAA